MELRLTTGRPARVDEVIAVRAEGRVQHAPANVTSTDGLKLPEVTPGGVIDA